MTIAWQSWARVGTVLIALGANPYAMAQEPETAPPTDQPPVQAETPGDEPSTSADLQPVPDPAFGGLPSAAAVVVPGMVAPVPPIGVAAPSVVGQYHVGYIHRPVLSRIFWYSIDNPYVEQLTGPTHARVFGTAHAPYYTSYRTIHNANWGAVYVPQTQCYAPGTYGYMATPDGQHPAGTTAYAPYGAASATYFGYYGPAGY